MKKLAHKRKVIGPRSHVRGEAELDKNTDLITPNPKLFPFVHTVSLILLTPFSFILYPYQKPGFKTDYK